MFPAPRFPASRVPVSRRTVGRAPTALCLTPLFPAAYPPGCVDPPCWTFLLKALFQLLTRPSQVEKVLLVTTAGSPRNRHRHLPPPRSPPSFVSYPNTSENALTERRALGGLPPTSYSRPPQTSSVDTLEVARHECFSPRCFFLRPFRPGRPNGLPFLRSLFLPYKTGPVLEFLVLAWAVLNPFLVHRPLIFFIAFRLALVF